MRQGPWAQGASLPNRLVAACQDALARHRVPARWRVSGPCQGRRGQGAGPVAAVAPACPDDAGRIPRALGRPPDPDGPPGRPVGPLPPLRHHLVPGRDPQISPPARRGAGRLVLPPAVRPGLAAVLPGRHRQGAGASHPEHARRAGHRPGGDRAVRDRPGHPAHLSVRAHHQPHRRRTRRAPVPPSAGAADRLFPGAAGRRFGGAGARAGEHPQFPHQLGAHPGDRPVLHLRVPGGDVLLFAAADLDRARLVSRSTSRSRPGRRRCSGGGSTRNSSAARRTRRSWSRASPASRR